jgi:hypothetical protein
MFCRKGAIFPIPYRRKALTVKKLNRAGNGLRPNHFLSLLGLPTGPQDKESEGGLALHVSL